MADKFFMREAEKAMIHQLYLTHTDREIGEVIGRSGRTVYGYRRRHGLVRPSMKGSRTMRDDLGKFCGSMKPPAVEVKPSAIQSLLSGRWAA